MKEELLEFVKEISIVNATRENPFSVSLVKMYKPDGTHTWKVSTSTNTALSKELKLFIIEPLPSSRTDEYLNDCRFDSIEEAVECFKQFFDIARHEKVMNKLTLDHYEAGFLKFLEKTKY
jgi:hypothetical protein